MEKYPGDGYINVICDVCGRKLHQKDTVLIKDKWNLQNGLVVCKDDIDKVNPQIKPTTIYERPVPNPERLRPESTDHYVTNEHSSRAPSKPRHLIAAISPIEDYIELRWTAPEDPGSDRITGYIIKRANPQLAFYITIEDNTNTNAEYYKDTTADLNTEYTYTVTAINGFGTSPESDPAYWPISRIAFDDIEYIIDESGNAIIDESSESIRDNYSNYGLL